MHIVTIVTCFSWSVSNNFNWSWKTTRCQFFYRWSHWDRILVKHIRYFVKLGNFSTCLLLLVYYLSFVLLDNLHLRTDLSFLHMIVQLQGGPMTWSMLRESAACKQRGTGRCADLWGRSMPNSLRLRFDDDMIVVFKAIKSGLLNSMRTYLLVYILFRPWVHICDPQKNLFQTCSSIS